MSLDFYYMPGSPPCSLVSLVFAAVGIESKVKAHCVDMMANEHMKPEFLKLNPQHTTPTIVDDGFVLWESRTIAKYLASKYGSKLYPQDLKTRAMVDQRMDFDLGTLYSDSVTTIWYALAKSTIPKYEEINGKYVKEFKEFFEMLQKQ